MTDTSQSQTESCPDCHALVSDLDAHVRWHRRVVADIAHAVDQADHRKVSS